MTDRKLRLKSRRFSSGNNRIVLDRSKVFTDLPKNFFENQLFGVLHMSLLLSIVMECFRWKKGQST